ncbi:MAG: ferrous iron transport protein B [Anaerovoracaceae bacterium]|jgi:ferrous iron transport protein B
MSVEVAQKIVTIALLGQPNSGKSTLFNGLTGARQKVGNWPGKTVEKKEGYFTRDGVKYKVVDLPGSYSLSANSEEEIITRDYIASGNGDVVCILADSSQLSRSLFMLADFAGIQCPAILLLNLMDVAEKQGKTIDGKELEKRLGIPVVPFVAADKKYYDEFYRAIERAVKEKCILQTTSLIENYEELDDEQYLKVRDLMPKEGLGRYSPQWLADKIIEGDDQVQGQVEKTMAEAEREKLHRLQGFFKKGALFTAGCKFRWIDDLLEGVVETREESRVFTKFDRLATHKRWGKPLAILIILLGLVASFIPAAPIMGLGSLIPGLGGPITDILTSIHAPQMLIDLIVQVVLNTLYLTVAMIGFVFGINLVFGLIEEVGYMARVSYAFDHTMAKLGLQGKSVMPFLVSFGCTIGGAAGTRVIDSWGQRVLTIALAWAVPCAATWAIVPVISTIFFGPWAPLVVVAIFLVAGLHMFITAKFFGPELIREEDRAGLIMELPPYHRPKWRALFRSIFVRTWDILARALKVIFVVSLVFWLLTYSTSGAQDDTLLFRLGKSIEPATLIFGLTWELFLAYISAMLSKEAALGVLAALYMGTGTIFSSTLGSPGSMIDGLGDVLMVSIGPASALAFIFAVTFNAPCLMAVASTYQETRSLKWTLKILGYYFAVSLLLALMAYHIGNLIF